VSPLLSNIIRFALLIFLQVYVLFELNPLHKQIVPYIYFIFILWLPFSVSRWWLLIIGFLTGLTLDYFTGQIGFHAAACTLVAYARPLLISILKPRAAEEFSYREPSFKSLDTVPYVTYVVVLTLLHHTYLSFLQLLQFGSFWQFLIRILLYTGISLLLIFTVEILFPRRLKFMTNVK
jgi:rod shape-determining protein MreD